MIKSVLKLALFLIIGIVAYNYFLGDEQEKEQARNIVQGTGKAIKKGVNVGVGLLKDEYKKFKEGKYDRALDKVGNLLQDAKQKGGAMVEDIKEWEDKRQLWQEKKEQLIKMIDDADGEMTAEQEQEMKDLEAEGKKLTKQGEELQKKVEKE